MFGIGFGFGIKDKQGREAKFMISLKIESRLPLNHDKNTVGYTLKWDYRYFWSKLVHKLWTITKQSGLVFFYKVYVKN